MSIEKETEQEPNGKQINTAAFSKCFQTNKKAK